MRASPSDSAENLEQGERADGLRFPFEDKRLDRLDSDGVADEAVRLGSDEHLSCAGSLLEPSSDVDSVAGDERLTFTADDDLAGVDPDARLEPVLGDGGAHLGRSANCAQRVVLVRDGDPEDGHHGIADELLDGAAVTLEDHAKILEVAPHPCAQRLGIRRLAERRRTDEVAEENGDDFALLAGRLGRSQRRPTRAAEARVALVLAPAVRASRHGRGVYERTGWSSASSMLAASVAANAGSKRPAPTSRTEAAPAATAARIESSGSRSSISAARS